MTKRGLPCSMLYIGVGASFIPEGIGRWMGPYPISNESLALCQDTAGLCQWVLNTLVCACALDSCSCQGMYYYYYYY